MFNKHNIYITASVVIGILVFALIGWALFLGKEEESVKQEVANKRFLSEGGSIGLSSTKTTFGKLVNTIKNDIKKSIEKEEDTVFKPTLSQRHSAPIADFFAASATAPEEDTVYFTERATGHVFKLNSTNNQTERILHTTVTGIQESIWTNNGHGIIRRYLDEKGNIASTYNELSIIKEDEDQLARYMLDNITSIVPSPSGNEIFYIIENDDGAYGYISNPTGENPKLIWSSWIRSWNSAWTTDTQILLTQSPSFGLGGASFLINTENGDESSIISLIPGLITNMSPSGNMLIYSSASSSGLSLFVRDTKTNIDKKIALSTLAQKCVWSKVDEKVMYCFVPNTLPKLRYPDSWYQGVVHFNDSLWKVDVLTGESEKVFEPQKENNLAIDAENPMLSSTEKYIFFINKSDQTLWSIKLKADKQNDKIKETTE